MLKSSIIYLLSSVVSRAFPFLLLPILTRFLTPSELGLVSIFQLIALTSQSIAGLSINVHIPRYYFSVTKAECAVLVFNSYAVLFTSCLFLMVFLGGISFFFESLFEIPRVATLMLPVLTFMNMSALLHLTLLRTLERPKTFMRYEIGLALTNFAFVIIFVVLLQLSWLGQVFATILSTTLLGILSIKNAHTLGFVSPRIDQHWIRQILSLSLPLIPHAIAGVIISVGDRLFLKEMMSSHVVGVYTVGYSFGMVVMLFSDAFLKAWNPWFFKKMASDSTASKSLIVFYMYVYIAALTVGAAIYSEIAQFILPLVVDPAYAEAAEVIPVICFAYTLFGLYQIFFPYFLHFKKASLVSYATVAAALVSIISNFVLIEHFGAIGAAYATALAFFTSATLVVIAVVRMANMPWLSPKLIRGEL